MSTGTDTFRRIDTLIRVGLRLANSARTGRILLARIAEAIELEWIPRPWGDDVAEQLQQAQSTAAEPIPWRRVQRILHEAWAAAPADELDELDPEPVAITPSSQVHRGVLDGSPVAIKVLRPGLAGSVRQDLVLLESLLAPLSAAFPALDARAVIAEFRERVLEELDLEHEAQVQRRFHRALRGHAFLSVPAPITRLAHENVLVSEWVDAAELNAAADPDQAAAQLVIFVIGGIREGIIHADPVPDNVLVYPDGRLAVLDFGATRVIEKERVEPSAAVVEAFCERDAGAMGAALEQLGVLPASLAELALDLVVSILDEFADPDPVRLDSDAVIELRDRLLSQPGPLSKLLTAGTLPRADLWPARGLAEAFATAAKLGATGPWRELTRTALRDGWSAAVD